VVNVRVQQFDDRGHSIGFEQWKRGFERSHAVVHLSFAGNAWEAIAGQHFEAIAIDRLGGLNAEPQLLQKSLPVFRRNQAATERVHIGFLIDHKHARAQAEFLEKSFVVSE
jgi:hypothetical protein